MGNLLVMILAASTAAGLSLGAIFSTRIFLVGITGALAAPVVIAAYATDPTALLFTVALSGFAWFCWAAALIAGLLAAMLRPEFDRELL